MATLLKETPPESLEEKLKRSREEVLGLLAEVERRREAEEQKNTEIANCWAAIENLQV